eukprot:TRINITY_DN78736_c0_g1_i1.p1 TRINITY_DN78736_c0_g1~~TRINITY_DN78736_c0_g1_i1.p1  ORF type:complete len:1016 (-),score=228.78 TRINITY_DN78736_c0_g1_i1:65-3112(-)
MFKFFKFKGCAPCVPDEKSRPEDDEGTICITSDTPLTGAVHSAFALPTSGTGLEAGPKEFSVVLDKSLGRDVGIDFVTAGPESPSGEGLFAANIRPNGLADLWNRVNPGRGVEGGLKVVDVNKVSGEPGKLLEQIEKDSVLIITVRRPEVGAAPTATMTKPVKEVGKAKAKPKAKAKAKASADKAEEVKEAHVIKVSSADDISKLREALDELCRVYPYLALDGHYLNKGVKEIQQALTDSDGELAADVLNRVEQEVHLEEDSLAVAFALFKKDGKDFLSEKEVKVMLQYLGFPSKKQDVDDVIQAVDTDGDKCMGLFEFQLYVGRMGGSFKLFALRKEQRASSGEGSSMKGEELREGLLECGIQDAAQAYWRLVVPTSEFEATARLQPCQKNAIRHIRALAKSNHEAALWKLQIRVKKLGYDDMALWKTLAWIREQAPILVHINVDSLLAFLEADTHYRNQFETERSGGLLKTDVRKKWERDLFMGAYDVPECKPFDRCKYGVLNPMFDSRGVVSCAQYGDSYLVLKDVRLRCTFSPEDSANLKANKLAVLDYYAHVLSSYTNAELMKTIDVALSNDPAKLGDSSAIAPMKYKETQIHGEVRLKDHVSRLVLCERHRKDPWQSFRAQEVCKKYGWTFSWMDEEQTRLSKETRKRVLGPKAWKKRLEALGCSTEEEATTASSSAETAVAAGSASSTGEASPAPAAEDGAASDAGSDAGSDAEAAPVEVTPPPRASLVSGGFCSQGCGRPVAPGRTRKGNPFTTCCKGCAMGFGHDLTCGAATHGEGMCRHGCGRPVNPGTTISGRPYDTCCRGCVTGTHDFTCGQLTNMTNDFSNNVCSPCSPAVEPGMCRMGCGRKAAVGAGGRKFDTCCRGCALGYGHSKVCKGPEASASSSSATNLNATNFDATNFNASANPPEPPPPPPPAAPPPEEAAPKAKAKAKTKAKAKAKAAVKRDDDAEPAAAMASEAAVEAAPKAKAKAKTKAKAKAVVKAAEAEQAAPEEVKEVKTRSNERVPL